ARLRRADRAARAAGAHAVGPAAAVVQPRWPWRPVRPAAPPARRVQAGGRGTAPRLLRRRAVAAAAGAGTGGRGRRVGHLRYHGAVRRAPGERGRTGGVDQEATPAAP